MILNSNCWVGQLVWGLLIESDGGTLPTAKKKTKLFNFSLPSPPWQTVIDGLKQAVRTLARCNTSPGWVNWSWKQISIAPGSFVPLGRYHRVENSRGSNIGHFQWPPREWKVENVRRDRTWAAVCLISGGEGDPCAQSGKANLLELLEEIQNGWSDIHVSSVWEFALWSLLPAPSAHRLRQGYLRCCSSCIPGHRGGISLTS